MGEVLRARDTRIGRVVALKTLADGFSCRTQLDSLADHPGEHLAQLLARHLP